LSDLCAAEADRCQQQRFGSFSRRLVHGMDDSDVVDHAPCDVTIGRGTEQGDVIREVRGARLLPPPVA
jgi:hypothetical protein